MNWNGEQKKKQKKKRRDKKRNDPLEVMPSGISMLIKPKQPSSFESPSPLELLNVLVKPVTFPVKEYLTERNKESSSCVWAIYRWIDWNTIISYIGKTMTSWRYIIYSD